MFARLEGFSEEPEATFVNAVMIAIEGVVYVGGGLFAVRCAACSALMYPRESELRQAGLEPKTAVQAMLLKEPMWR